MGHPAPRVALWALVGLLLVGGLAAIPGAWASSTPTYTLNGWVEQPGTFAPVPAGVTVDLVSEATHAVFTATTQTSGGVPSGQFTFTGANTGGALGPGWWGVMVPPQARLHLTGCNPCAILPAQTIPQYQYYNSTALTTVLYPVTIPNVEVLAYNTTIFGNATAGGLPAANASVQLLAPQFGSLVLGNATTNRTGAFNFTAPWGTWVLRATLPQSPSQFDIEQVTVAGTQMTVNPTITGFRAYGHVNQAASPTAHVPNGGNATVVDLANENIYTYPVPPGGFYSVGGYPANFVGPGNATFAVVLSIVGYGTVWYPWTVNATSGPVAKDVTAPAQAPPATYATTLDFSTGFSNLTVTTAATLGNDSTFPMLPNASVGQLWAQLGLDYNHSLSFPSADLATVLGWIQGAGPFFPADQAHASVSGVPFGANQNFSFASSTGCSGSCGLGTSAGLNLTWGASYNTTSSVSASLKNYTLAFNFRHPTHEQAFNYTVKLPAGYVLAAGQAAPAGATLMPAGPGGTWTSFTLVAQPYATASSTATLSIVKYGSVTAIVNVTTQNFAFSSQNVLNQTRGNYTVTVGVGQNVTFSAVNSTFPTGTNGTLYQWAFGDSGTMSSAQPTTYHTYAASGAYSGSLTVTSSGGNTSATTFLVYAGALAPTAAISANASAMQNAGGVNYTIVNWSTTLHFNASMSAAPLYAGAPVPGIVSVASWNLSSHSFYTTANYTAASGANASAQNFSYTFRGAGYYLTNTTIGGQSVAFLGWRYNVTLTIWDGAGHTATATMVVLVRDTQKPSPAVTIQNAAGRTVTSAGLVEGSNETAEVYLSAANSTDPNNGSLTWYNWTVTNAGNSSVGLYDNLSAGPGFKMPARPHYWLPAQTKPYTVNLTVVDRAGNAANQSATVSVTINVSQRPVLSVTNLTAPSKMTEGSSYTVWVNVTNTLGVNSTAENVSVAFYLLPPSGAGSRIAIAGSPGSVQFFNYSSDGTVASSAYATGLTSLAYNTTVRAQITYHPGRSGTFNLWVNATATNEFASSYTQGANQASVPVTLAPNPLNQLLLYAGIVGAVVVVFVVIGLWYRRSRRPATKGTSGGKSSGSGKAGLERSKRPKDDEDDD